MRARIFTAVIGVGLLVLQTGCGGDAVFVECTKGSTTISFVRT